MAKHDFSHLFATPSVIADTLKRGHRVTDENWLKIVELINPDLLSAIDLATLRYVLDPQVERRGGPSIKTVSAPLIETLEAIERADVPADFIAGLVRRLRNRESYTRANSDHQYAKRFWKQHRDRIIVYLYDQIIMQLKVGCTFIEIEPFGGLAVPRGNAPKNEKATVILNTLLSERSVYTSPSPNTLMKIVAQDPHRKRSVKR